MIYHSRYNPDPRELSETLLPVKAGLRVSDLGPQTIVTTILVME